jgi:uncharacterized membrane protein YeaQ/YmgE (transglycosylase-associated protein family)
MEIVLTLILGGMTGWLASILVKTEVAMGIVVSVAVGAVGSFLGVAMAGALALHAQSAHSWILVVVSAILSGAWFVGLLRATLGLFSGSETCY